jgi:hypothetical protein
MAWLDPFDQIAYRAMVGRHVNPIVGSIDRDVVLSCRVAKQPPGWRLHQDAIEERRQLASQQLVEQGVLAIIDIHEYFPSITCAALEAVIGQLPVHRSSFVQLLDWLETLRATSAVTGLPIGLDGSQILGNGLLVPGDHVLTNLGVPFLRYMDDTWLFLRHEHQFPAILDEYMRVVSSPPLRLMCHPHKSVVLDPLAALETIQRSAIQYVEAALEDPDRDGLATALELFEYAMEAPDDRKPELRRSLATLKDHRAPEAFEALAADVTLIALAPGNWRGFIRSLLADHKAAKKTAVRDWLVERVRGPMSEDDAYTTLVLLQAAAPVLNLTKEEGRRVFDAAQRAETWAEPVQIGAVHLWGRSHAFKPHTAVEATEAAPTLTSKRAYALTLESRRGNKKMKAWVDAVHRSHPDLDATAAWLEAA